MLNYRLVAALILLLTAVFPMATQWAMEANGGWFRPFFVWGFMIFSCYMMQRKRTWDEP